MSTGLDPNTRTFIREKIRGTVPDFVTENERALREKEEGQIKIRYWFYPDLIRTVTDGRMGVVECYQFTADAERMDVKTTLGRAQRETIDHLNQKFEEYARALPTYRELSTVGRMMAIAAWLQQSSARDRVDLDALLSVELSPFKTPKRTRKLLAVTAEISASDKAGGKIWTRRKVYDLNTVLEGVKPSTDDKDILDLAKTHFSRMKDPELVPSVVQNAKAKIRQMEAKVKSLKSKIDQEEKILDHSSEYEVNQFKAMVDEFNSLRSEYNDAVDSYNRSIENKGTIVSVGGGINLRPRDFAKALHVPDSPSIQRIRSSREILRSSPGGVGATATDTPKLYPRPWTLVSEQSTNELTKKRWSNSIQGTMSVEANSKSGYCRFMVLTKENYIETTVKPGRKEMVVATSAYPTEIVATGDFSQGGLIILRRGKKIGAAAPSKESE
jgi:hypothetical protein